MCFLKIMIKVRCFKILLVTRLFWTFFSNLTKILIFLENSSKGISFVKLTLLHFFEQNLELFRNFVWRVFFWKIELRLVLHVLYQSLSRPIPYRSLRGPAQDFHTLSLKREFTLYRKSFLNIFFPIWAKFWYFQTICLKGFLLEHWLPFTFLSKILSF